jgi:glycerol-3-phosphate acyltransferase PlsY
MGARNVAGEIGRGAGSAAGAIDSTKGTLADWAANQAAPSEPWVLAAGVAAVVGLGFPAWAGFRGGQGNATSLGVLTVLLPRSTLAGLLAFGSLYLATRRFDVSTAIGLGLIVLMAWQLGAAAIRARYAAVLFVSIGAKTVLDRPRRRNRARPGRGEGRSAIADCRIHRPLKILRCVAHNEGQLGTTKADERGWRRSSTGLPVT